MRRGESSTFKAIGYKYTYMMLIRLCKHMMVRVYIVKLVCRMMYIIIITNNFLLFLLYFLSVAD